LADVALEEEEEEEEEETWAQVETDKVTQIPQALDSLVVVVWETAEVDSTQLSCSGPPVARMQQTPPVTEPLQLPSPVVEQQIPVVLLFGQGVEAVTHYDTAVMLSL
jgi:hypothetical protein